jgi:spermidine synthase
MANNNANATNANPARYLPLLFLLFAGSGCAALIYEIVWYQLLQLVIGSSAISLGVLLATFMGGLCLGSIALPRIRIAREMHPLRAYALIEIGIGICGVLALFGMPLVDYVYTEAVGHGMPAILLRAFVSAICLLPPTFLMGASLPAISRWLRATPRGVVWLGLLYGGNTAGAVFGCLFAGFYLLRVFDMTVATFVAAAINFAIAIVSLALSRRTPENIALDPASSASFASVPSGPPHPAAAKRKLEPQRAPVVPAPLPVLFTIALSGACALGAEVVWTRLLGLLLGATVYTFSIILAVFLFGLGLGSTAGARISRVVNSRMALGWCQLLLAFATAWTAWTISKSLPYWPINPLLSSSPWFTFQVDIARVLWTIFPATFLWGASFPLALAALATREEDSAQLVGSVYAWNTAGAIVGALAFSMIVIPQEGTLVSERVLIIVAALSAIIVLTSALWPARKRIDAIALIVASLVGATYLASQIFDVPGDLIAYGRRFMTSRNRSQIYYTHEGMNSSIAVSRWDDGALQFHVSGKVEASTESYDMRLQRLLGHMPALLHANPRSVLIVGFGAGVTSGTFVLHPQMQRIVICEMEKAIPPVSTEYFGNENYHVMNDRRTQIFYDDARHYVETTREKFDIITSDPIHPWVKGSATLYSREYFQMVKQHLNPGGIVTQWVPLYESDPATVKSEIATFFDVFPGGTLWANDINGEGYDIFMLGQAEPGKIDVDSIQAKLASPEYARVAQSLRDVGVRNAVDLLSTYAGQQQDLQPWLVRAQINRDRSLRLQYLAGMALNVNDEAGIYREILQYRQFPVNLITGSRENLEALVLELHAGGR